MALSCARFGALCIYFLLSLPPSVCYLCECMMTEWMGREKCKWESRVHCAERVVSLPSPFAVRRKTLYVEINFPTPCSVLIQYSCCWCYFVPLCPPSRTIHSVFSRRCVGAANFPLDILVWVFTLTRARSVSCRKYNQFYFYSLPTFPSLKYFSRRVESFPKRKSCNSPTPGGERDRFSEN